METLVLTTLNARYAHASLGLRYLYANLEELREQANIREFTLSQDPQTIATAIATLKPAIVGFGVYIWNTRQTLAVILELRQRAPGCIIVVGGPEVSFESESQEICKIADHVVKGEGELAFLSLCRERFAGNVPEKFIRAPLPQVTDLRSPYPFYTDEDIHNRILYVEASRGCPFSCEFCLSSLDERVRNFPMPALFRDFQMLLDRGARQFKFIDRTFNLNPKVAGAILEFFLQNVHLGIFLHFEMVPDLLPESLRTIIRRFPQGALQFEIGIQTLNEAVSERISRKQNVEKTARNLRFLLQETGVYVHADLIAGLPGEDEESFRRGFDRLAGLNPHEIQVGILKRLKGTPIGRHDQQWEMVYAAEPPFEILATKCMPAHVLRRIGIFAKFWDRIANSGRFPQTLKTLRAMPGSLYDRFMDLAQFLYGRFQRTHSIDLSALHAAIQTYLVERLSVPSGEASEPSLRLSHVPKVEIPYLPKRQRRNLLSTVR